MDITNITTQQEAFCHEMLKGVSPVIAYMATFDCGHLPSKKVTQLATALFRRKFIKERIAELRNQAARVAIVEGSQVVREWAAIAFGDVNSVVQHQRVNCRYCYGKNNKYQWIDEDEFARSISKAIDNNATILDSDGGFGFKTNSDPNKCCLKCSGDGIGRVFIQDTRYLAENEKKLYGGVKQGRDGIEIKIRDQDAALLNLAKYLRLLEPEQKDNQNGQLEIVIKGGLPE